MPWAAMAADSSTSIQANVGPLFDFWLTQSSSDDQAASDTGAALTATSFNIGETEINAGGKQRSTVGFYHLKANVPWRLKVHRSTSSIDGAGMSYKMKLDGWLWDDSRVFTLDGTDKELDAEDPPGTQLNQRFGLWLQGVTWSTPSGNYTETVTFTMSAQ